jgi:hypothetical protein
MVEVFKTNITNKANSKRILSILKDVFPFLKINFDLSDCDKILRVEGEIIEVQKVIMILKNNGFKCEVLK